MSSEVDTELVQLELSPQLRANSSFMKIMATLFYYGNSAMNAAQLVVAVRALNLLPLRGETPRSTIQGIISTSRKTARDLHQPDPFQIDRDNSARGAVYSIAPEVLNGAEPLQGHDVPDEPIVLKPVRRETTGPSGGGGGSSGSSLINKRARKAPKPYEPSSFRTSSKSSKLRRPGSKSGNGSSKSRTRKVQYRDDSDSDLFSDDDDVDSDDSASGTGSPNGSRSNSRDRLPLDDDTIKLYSLLYAPPTDDLNYIQTANVERYPAASHFAVSQQTGYSYPRFRSHDKIKIPKDCCEDRFAVRDIKLLDEKTQELSIAGRVFVLADGHGGPGCSEYFIRHVPVAVQTICAKYTAEQVSELEIQTKLEVEFKDMVAELDEEYLSIKREEFQKQAELMEVDKAKKMEPATTGDSDAMETDEASDNPGTKVNNDGCTLIINLLVGEWLVNINVGDSRSILMSAPEYTKTDVNGYDYSNSPVIDQNYKMDVVFASQDHKPYLEHLAREIMDKGGEFVDSVQNRVIRVDLDKTKDDGNRHAKRLALKHARIRPRDYQPPAGHEYWKANSSSPNSPYTINGNGQQVKVRIRDDKIPSLNVARSCGDLDFKMDPKRKIISCEPDITFVRVLDHSHRQQVALEGNTTVDSKSKPRRYFLFMSSDGCFDHMHEEIPEKQNRIVAKGLGHFIEEGEKFGEAYWSREEDEILDALEKQTSDAAAIEPPTSSSATISHETSTVEPAADTTHSHGNAVDNTTTAMDTTATEDGADVSAAGTPMVTDTPPAVDGVDQPSATPQPPRPLLVVPELPREEIKRRRIKERILANTVRYFTNREGDLAVFSSTLQDYDDCTIILVEI
ncbi:phosphatase 2C-like domain-containing protein [Umbelopsis sp. AD052]|nr:phosphatase 2C-like domain-containing protein [Umbelopsis sp. AD052]